MKFKVLRRGPPKYYVIGVRVRDHDFLDVRVRGQGRTRLSADKGVRVDRSLHQNIHKMS